MSKTEIKIAKAKLSLDNDKFFAVIEGEKNKLPVAAPSMGNQKWVSGKEVTGVILPETNHFHICRELNHTRKGKLFGITMENDLMDEFTRIMVVDDFRPKMKATVSFYPNFYEAGEQLQARKSLISNF